MVFVVKSDGNIKGDDHGSIYRSNISLTIFNSAVSVESSFLYAGWRGQRNGATCNNSQAKYRWSNTLMVVLRLISVYKWLGRWCQGPASSEAVWSDHAPRWENAFTEKQVGEFCDDWGEHSAAFLQKSGRNQDSQWRLRTEKFTRIMTSSRDDKNRYRIFPTVTSKCCMLLLRVCS